MYCELGHDRAGAAKLLHVSVRTLHNWESGRCAIPFAAYKLLRVMLRLELPGKAWEGWAFNRGLLWSPGGQSFAAHDFSWLSLLVRQARMFVQLYRERSAILQELEAARRALSVPPRPASACLDELVELGLDGGLPSLAAATFNAASLSQATLAAGASRRYRLASPGAAGGRAGEDGGGAGGDVLVTRHKPRTGERRPTAATQKPRVDPALGRSAA